MRGEHDLAPVATPPDVDGVARIIGGAGGIRFQWQELDWGAQVVGDAAEELVDVAEVVAGLGVRLSALQVLNARTSAAGVHAFSTGGAAADAVGVAQQQIRSSSAELRGTADRIRWSRAAYEAAELMVRAAIDDSPLGRVPDEPLSIVVSPLNVRRTSSEGTCVSGTVDNLLEEVSRAAAEPGNAFEVLEVQGESGPTYVVVIPGSEGWTWENPFSFVGIVEAMSGNSEYVQDAVMRALDEVGAEKGATVVLAGYSQGGMHAMNLANSGPLPEKYEVDLVVTAGSPVEREAATEGTRFLHLSHTLDAVPHADLLPHEDRPNQVSVVLDHKVGLREGEDFGLGPAHKINSYREGAQAVDLSTHPSIAPITAALGTAVAGSTATRHMFQVTRPPLIGPQAVRAGDSMGPRDMKERSAPGSSDRPGNK